VGHRYDESGSERALYEKPWPGAAEVLDDKQKGELFTIDSVVYEFPPQWNYTGKQAPIFASPPRN
jgi:hypothetical protein